MYLSYFTDKSRIANIFNDYFVNIANHIEAPRGLR